MDFRQDEVHQELQAMYRDFAQNTVKPLAAELDKEEKFPYDTVKQMAEMNMLGIPFPEEYEGAGLDELSYVQAVEELSKVCASTGVTLSAHTSLCTWPIYKFGTEDQKKKYLPDLCSGRKLGAFGLTEPSAGTDAAMQKTVAEDKGDHYLLNGSKIFITNAEPASVYVVFAMTDKEKGNHGISAFILERGMEGFTVGKHEEKMGIRGSSTCELIFQDGGRIGIAAQALGIAEGAIEETVQYVQERTQVGRRISQFQNTQFELAKMQANTEAARMLVYEAACACDAGEPFTHLAAMAKLVASNNASDVTRRCVQLYGGYGYTRDYPIERMMRDAKITEIYEGTSEVQMMVISGWMGVK